MSLSAQRASPPDAFKALSGPARWSRRYIERAGRLAVALALLALPLAVNAQQPDRAYRVGYLGTSPPNTPESLQMVEALRRGLGELGWVESKNLVIEWRYAEGRAERFPNLAADLARLKVDLIVAVGAPATRASREATTTIPIVGIALSDPVGQGLVASLVRPGGNVTGLATLFSELAAKRLEFLREALPGVSLVAVLWNAANPGNVLQFEETRVAARALGLRLQSVEVRGPDDFQGAFAAMTRTRPEALLILADPLIFAYRTQIVDFAGKTQLPAIHPLGSLYKPGG